MRPSCTSTLSFNQGDLVLSPDMDFCETRPEPFVATVALTPSLEQVFKHVPQSSNVFHAYSLGEARQSIIGSVQMELAELPDVHRMTNTAIDELTKPIADHYSSISPVTSHALQSYLPYRTAALFSGISITLSLLTFTISFTLFRRQWKRLFLHPQRFFTSSQGQFIHILDDSENPSLIENNAPFLYLTKNEFLALQGLAKETLQMTRDSVPPIQFHQLFLHEFIQMLLLLTTPRRRHSYNPLNASTPSLYICIYKSINTNNYPNMVTFSRDS